MTDFVEISSTGLPEITVKLQRWPDAVRTAMARVIYGEAVLLQTALKTDALNGGILNARTRRLQRSVHIETEVSGAKISTLVGTDVFYAAILEDGWQGMVRAHTRTITQVFGRAIDPTEIQVRSYHMTIPAFRAFGKTFDAKAPGIRDRLSAALIRISGETLQ